jgi:hypothetical protein
MKELDRGTVDIDKLISIIPIKSKYLFSYYIPDCYYYPKIGLTGIGFAPRKLRSELSPKRYCSGCGVSNRSPPMMK